MVNCFICYCFYQMFKKFGCYFIGKNDWCFYGGEFMW